MSAAEPLVLAIDQGTTGSTVVVMTPRGDVLCRANQEFTQHLPAPGLVEHEPDELYESVLGALQRCLDDAPVDARARIAAIGITNQRETTLLWDRKSGRPVHRALVWQDRRTTELCSRFKKHEPLIRRVTGLVVDPYFSASKLKWLLDQDQTLQRRAAGGSLCFGTVDSYLVQRLADWTDHEGVIEMTNASRTSLMDLRRRTWSPQMCELWGIPEAVLPRIMPTVGEFARTQGVPGLPDGIPILAVAGDQHAALFGQGCVQAGQAKCTYGTGAFVLVNTGDVPRTNEHGLLTTLAWQIGDRPVFALEGAAFIAGAAVQWLRDGLSIIDSAEEIESLAATVDSTDGVTFVPALTGLGAPHWDPEARGLICGLTRGTTRAHLARATLEGISFQVCELLELMAASLTSDGSDLHHVRVDGGACRNNLLMQMQADHFGISVHRPAEIESTARGAGLLAALGAGFIPTVTEAADSIRVERIFAPSWDASRRRAERARWEQAVARARCC